MNDNFVTITDIKSVLTKQAYVLFYIKWVKPLKKNIFDTQKNKSYNQHICDCFDINRQRDANGKSLI